jgi:hypothetical protein
MLVDLRLLERAGGLYATIKFSHHSDHHVSFLTSQVHVTVLGRNTHNKKAVKECNMIPLLVLGTLLGTGCITTTGRRRVQEAPNALVTQLPTEQARWAGSGEAVRPGHWAAIK